MSKKIMHLVIVSCMAVNVQAQQVKHRSCDVNTPPTAEATIVEQYIIWDACSQNQHPDLVRTDSGDFYCVISCREDVQVIKSTDDCVSWTKVGQVPPPTISPPADFLKNPKICIRPGDGALMLTANAILPVGGGQSWLFVSTDGFATWTDNAIGSRGEWLWRTAWHNYDGNDYSYNWGRDRYDSGTGTIELYRCTDTSGVIMNDASIIATYTDDYPNETGWAFEPNDRAVALLRKDGGSEIPKLGTSVPPYTGWTWKDVAMTDTPVSKIGCPELTILDDGRIIASVRNYDSSSNHYETALYWVNVETATLTKFFVLPGGDADGGYTFGYTGAVFYDDYLWIVYNSDYGPSTNDGDVFFAKIYIPPAP